MCPMTNTTRPAGTLQPPPPSSRSKRSRELSARLQTVISLAWKCTEGCRQLNATLGLPARPTTPETSSTSPQKPSKSSAPSSGTERQTESDELYPCGELVARKPGQS